MNVLVTGGAGYIGSHAARQLHTDGHGVVVFDNLFRGHRAAVPDDVPFVQADILDTDVVEQTLRKYAIDCVMHFAALTYVGESVEQPLAYHHNNAVGAVSLLRAMERADVKRIVFSSTCATYGEPATMPITEDTPQLPINPYGWSKLYVERVLLDHAASHDAFTFAALRYFNVAGCATDGSIGEDHDPETHVIPLLLLTAMGKREHFTIFGDDYGTPDGTCIRDYVHVEDLIDAHVLVMNSLQPGDQRRYNVGTGQGVSVRQVIDAAKRITGVDFPVQLGARRPGDPPQLYANADKIKHELGWVARYTDIALTIETAWRWFKDHPDGYSGR